MQKTRLGISVGLLGAATYFAIFFWDYLAAIVFVGYILLFEENIWLKKASVKAVSLVFGFSLLYSIIALLPNVIEFIGDVFGIFGGDFQLTFIDNIVTAISTGLTIIKKVLFIVLGIKALNQGSITIPVIDSLVNKHLG